MEETENWECCPTVPFVHLQRVVHLECFEKLPRSCCGREETFSKKTNHIDCTLKSAFSNEDFARRNHPLQQNGSFFTHQLQLGVPISNSVSQSLGKGGPLASV